MKLFRNKNFISSLCLVLVAFLFTPSVIKMAHLIFEHEHSVCKAIGELHIHEVELDCDFYDFNLSPQIHASLVEVQKPLVIYISDKIATQYTFLSKYQKLHFALRGPPSAS